MTEATSTVIIPVGDVVGVGMGVGAVVIEDVGLVVGTDGS
jgi:hypothetical protein